MGFTCIKFMQNDTAGVRSIYLFIYPWVYGICVELNPRLTRVRRVSTVNTKSAAYFIFMFFLGRTVFFPFLVLRKGPMYRRRLWQDYPFIIWVKNASIP